MLGADLLAEFLEFVIVEIPEIARGDADRADAEPRLQVVDAVEIDQPFQRLFQRRGVVIALRFRAARRPQRRRRNPRREEAGHAESRDQRGAGFVEHRSGAFARSDRIPGHRGRNHVPEFLQPVDAFVGVVAGDDRGVDGADRDAGNPFRLEAGTAQRLKGAGLVGAERAAALQHQHTHRIGRRRCGRGIGIIHRDRQLEENECATVAAVRNGVNQRDRSKDHAGFIALIEHELFGKPAPITIL